MSMSIHTSLPGQPAWSVLRVGLGTMPLCLPGRPDRAAAKAVVRSAVEAGLGLIDTADAYGRDDGERGYGEALVREALGEMGMSVSVSPLDGGPMVATKGGMKRPGGRWAHAGRPEDLREACHGSLRALGTDTIPLYQLHAPDPAVPIEESVGALHRLREEGKIALVGLSNVTEDELARAATVTPVATVQNRLAVWEPGYRKPPMVRACEEGGMTFIAHSPFGGEERAAGLVTHAPLAQAARALGLTPHEAALHWLLSMSPSVVAVPGTTRDGRAQGWLRALHADSAASQRRRIRRALRGLPGNRGLTRRLLHRLLGRVGG